MVRLRVMSSVFVIAIVCGTGGCGTAADTGPSGGGGGTGVLPVGGQKDAGIADAGWNDAGTDLRDAGTACDLGPKVSGSTITWYAAGPTDVGACSVPLALTHYAAVDPTQWKGSAACGMCLDVFGPDGGATRVRVVDLCPGCAPNHVDLSRAAFEDLAPESVGRLDGSVQPVVCDVTGNIQYRFDSGSNAWYLQLVIWNHAQPVAKVELQPLAGGDWVEMKRQAYNAFTYTSTAGAMPGQVPFRVTDVHGHVLVDPAVIITPGTVFDGAAQFPLTCGG